MKIVSLAAVIALGGIVFALSGVPATSEADSHEASCETCGKAKAGTCPHCDSGKECPHCDHGKACPHCGHHGHHGNWAGPAWEYKCVRPGKKPEAMEQLVDALGAEGWRLKGADDGTWCFSRIKRSE